LSLFPENILITEENNKNVELFKNEAMRETSKKLSFL
jgi:hypothetical protein